jgi:hypothetical protein
MADAGSGRPLQAMNRIVALAPDPHERAKRWGEMIYAAIEQLNEGRLAQTVSILEVASRLIAEKAPGPGDRRQSAVSGRSGRSPTTSCGAWPKPRTKHGLLRKVLLFFPSLNPEMLLTHLDARFAARSGSSS